MKLSFCTLLWQASGGALREGKPRETYGGPEDEAGTGPLGYCESAYDCGGCGIMQNVLSRFEGTGMWVCPECVSDLTKSSRESGTKMMITGHYHEGPCQNPSCSRQEKAEPDDQFDPRWCIVLQLVLFPT